ncbi:ABC transporter ATP-binding protein [Halohasta litorea]|uniref:ABC-type D-xylose/L-arabinose transporter n=1 Tax=Halohasta litorea TaxID=869891 RepID=A0ABD6D560_9EURY|nr:ABC transporter ATP-binding protein [Halohasta litorea]
MATITLQDIRKKYGSDVAIEGINLDIRDGEFVTLVGPSGCGKSTTIEMIAGLTKPTSGTVSIGERDVTALPPKDRGIAMVFQNIALFPHKNVYDNISFGLQLRNFDKAEMDRRVEDAANTVQLSGMLDRMPSEMSGGQRQRVAIARAIVREPDVFLMDEPLANLDAELRVHMRTQLQRIHNKLDTTIVYVTHDQAQAMTMSDRIAVLNDGELQQIDPPLVCYHEPANRFVAGFIGSPAMNFISGEITTDGFRSDSGHGDVEFDPAAIGVQAGQDVTLGVRPEHVIPVDEAVGDVTDTIETYTDVIEPMGDEIFVYLVTSKGETVDMEDPSASGQILMNVGPGTDVAENQELSVVFDKTNLHLFDAETEEALAHGLSEPVRVDTSVDTSADSEVSSDDD